MYSALNPMRSEIRAENISKTPGARMNSPFASRALRRMEVMRAISSSGCGAAKLAIYGEENGGGYGGERDQQKGQRHDRPDIVRLHGLDQHVAEPALRREHLADQRPEQRQRKTEPEPGDDLRHGSRQHDAPGGLDRGQAHRLRDAEIDLADVAHGVHRKDRDRDDAVNHAESDLRRNAKAEEQQDHRIERDLRDGVERHKDRFGDVARKPVRPEHEPDDEP